MDYFIEVARQGSFRKAAQKLFVSQQGISRQIMAIEKELDLGKGVTIAPHILLRNTNQEIVFCPFADTEHSDAISLYAIWKDEKYRIDVENLIGQEI